MLASISLRFNADEGLALHQGLRPSELSFSRLMLTARKVALVWLFDTIHQFLVIAYGQHSAYHRRAQLTAPSVRLLYRALWKRHVPPGRSKVSQLRSLRHVSNSQLRGGHFRFGIPPKLHVRRVLTESR
jgi:hypothetical protein